MLTQSDPEAVSATLPALVVRSCGVRSLVGHCSRVLFVEGWVFFRVGRWCDA